MGHFFLCAHCSHFSRGVGGFWAGLEVSYSIDAMQGIAYVEGAIDSDAMLTVVAKASKHVELCYIDSMHRPPSTTTTNMPKDTTGDTLSHSNGNQPPLPLPPSTAAAADKVPDNKKKPSNCCMM